MFISRSRKRFVESMAVAVVITTPGEQVVVKLPGRRSVSSTDLV